MAMCGPFLRRSIVKKIVTVSFIVFAISVIARNKLIMKANICDGVIRSAFKNTAISPGRVTKISPSFRSSDFSTGIHGRLISRTWTSATNQSSRITNINARVTRKLITKPVHKRHSSKNYTFRPIDPFQFTYLINDAEMWKEKCLNLSVVAYVHSAPSHFKRRNLIRSTWASSVARRNLNMALVFFVGYSSNHSRTLSRENDQFHDLVQENYVDHYTNLTLKAVSAMKWLHMHCPQVPTVLKTDDDVFVDIKRLREFLNVILPKSFFNTDKVIMCNVWIDGYPFRHSGNKWVVGKEEYVFETYPIFCQGVAFLMTSAAVRAIFQALIGEEFFKHDDVFLTGIVAQKAGVAHHAINKMYLTESVKRDKADLIFFLPSEDKFIQLWKNSLS